MANTMTYYEREQLKRFADRGRGLRECLIMIAHWQRQSVPISLTRYAAMWADSDIHGDDWDNQALRDEWPLNEENMVRPGCSDITEGVNK